MKMECRWSKNGFHNTENGAFVEMLHNFCYYVNECNYFYNRLCFVTRKGSIFCIWVYIKYKQITCKKLSFFVFLGQKLDFLKIIVIM